MQSVTVPLETAIDPGVVGRHGHLWVGPDVVLAGFGRAAEIPVDRASGHAGTEKAQSALAALAGPDAVIAPGSGPVAFAAFPFRPDSPGTLVVPEVVIARSGSQCWLTATGLSVDDALERVASLAGAVPPEVPDSRITVESVIDPGEWRDHIVGGAIAAIRSGRLTKAVLARELRVRADGPIDTARILDRLLAAHTAAMVFSVDGFVGASPELLVARSGDVVTAHPLAGTAPRHDDPALDRRTADDLLASTKNQWEHRITIEWFLDELLPFCSYVDAEPEPTIVTLPNVHHLGTRVEGRLSAPAASILELVAALHPTPAVGGQPQADALVLIAEIERADRGRYAGPVGWVDGRGNGAFAVGIRSAEIDGADARLFAGVGVVADSDPVAELAETEAKFQAMLPALLGA